MAKKGLRKFEIMQEVERIDIDKVIDWVDGIDCNCLIVLHDKDERAPHYHVFVSMKNERKINDIARMVDVKPQYVEHIQKWKNALAYAFHFTDGARDDGKYIYDETAIKYFKGVDYEEIRKQDEKYKQEKTRQKDVQDLIYKYGECEISKAVLLANINACDYHKYSRMIKNMQDYRIIKVRDRDMNVLYLTGESGSGKTTLAKYMARILNYDYFVSGSGKDVLDGYDKEECIILDDLRGDAFTKSELFKLTDNNTNSSVKSRYKNKDISYCKLMIITSIKAPYELYNWNEDKDETFEQFSRRLQHTYISIAKDGRVFYKYMNTETNTITQKLCQDFDMGLVFFALGIEKRVGSQKIDTLFKKIGETIKEKQPSDEEEIIDLFF